MTAFRAEFSHRATLADLPRFLAFATQCCETAGVDPAARFDLELALDEACSNVLEHAYNGQGGMLGVVFETRGHDVVITVSDQGRAFDPNDVPSPDLTAPLEDRPIGGLGLHLIKKLMDQVRFTFSPTGNTLVMVKRKVIAPAARSGGAAARRGK